MAMIDITKSAPTVRRLHGLRSAGNEADIEDCVLAWDDHVGRKAQPRPHR